MKRHCVTIARSVSVSSWEVAWGRDFIEQQLISVQ
jgi:hypothetical protein